MKNITIMSLLLFLVFTTSIEAKGAKSGITKAMITKGIPKIKKMIAASKRSKSIANKAIRKTVPKNLTGLYKFKASNKKPYLGKSINIQKRLTQHIRSNKLHPKDINTISFAKVAKKDVLKVEKLKIMKADKATGGNLANKQHAPRSYSKQKREILAEEVLKNKALLKTKF